MMYNFGVLWHIFLLSGKQVGRKSVFIAIHYGFIASNCFFSLKECHSCQITNIMLWYYSMAVISHMSSNP